MMTYKRMRIVSVTGHRERVVSKGQAWGQLLRVPMLPTALADPLAGWWVTGQQLAPVPLGLVLVSSLFLYSAGMVWNDWFDYPLDCRQRPERPLPSGRVARGAAAGVAASLMLLGVAAAWGAGWWSGMIALGLVGLIFLYNAHAKQHGVWGPVVMGSCRALNFAFGWPTWVMSAAWMPLVLGGYVAGVTAYAAGEVEQPQRRSRVRWALRGIVAVDALLVAVRGEPVGAVAVLALLLPVVVLSRWWEST